MSKTQDRKLMFEKIAASFAPAGRTINEFMRALSGDSGELMRTLAANTGGLGKDVVQLGRKGVDTATQTTKAELEKLLRAKTPPSSLRNVLGAPIESYKSPALVGAGVGAGAGALADTSTENDNPIFGSRTHRGTTSDRIRSILTGGIAGAGIGAGLRAARMPASTAREFLAKAPGKAGMDELLRYATQGQHGLALSSDEWRNLRTGLESQLQPGGALTAPGMKGSLLDAATSRAEAAPLLDKLKTMLGPIEDPNAFHFRTPEEVGNYRQFFSGTPGGWRESARKRLFGNNLVDEHRRILNTITSGDSPDLALRMGLAPAGGAAHTDLGYGYEQFNKEFKNQASRHYNEKELGQLKDLMPRLDMEQAADKGYQHYNRLLRLPQSQAGRMQELTRAIDAAANASPEASAAFDRGILSPTVSKMIDELNSMGGRYAR